MSANIVCPTCGKQFRLKEELLGRKVRCTACKESFIAEAEIELAPAPDFHDETPRYATPSPVPRSSQLTTRQQSELEAALKAIASRAGWQFALLGVLGLGLPYLGLQLRILHGMGAATPTVATCMAGIGGFFWFAGNSVWGGPLLRKINIFGLGSTQSGGNPSVQRRANTNRGPVSCRPTSGWGLSS